MDVLFRLYSKHQRETSSGWDRLGGTSRADKERKHLQRCESFLFCAVLQGIKQTPRSGRRFMCTERKVESGISSRRACGEFGKGAQARVSMETG